MEENTDEKSKLAIKLLKEYKGDKYSFGLGCFSDLGKFVKEFGDNTLLIISQHEWAKFLRNEIKYILKLNYINIVEETGTSGENTPAEDVYKLADLIKSTNPDSVLCVGGGSAIDCAKAANILAILSPNSNNLEPFFGVGMVSEMMQKAGIKKLYPLVAVQVAAGSGSHITKYSNVTDLSKNQKKLIVDNAIIPDRAVFDYLTTLTMPLNLTKDGAMDGFSHCLEVYYGANEKAENFNLVEQVCLTGIELIVNNLPLLIKNPENKELREKIGLATDLGAYSIMIYGTNGAHLNSFSFVDIMTHGKACAILNPYYTVFFSPAIEKKLGKIALIYKKYIKEDIENLSGRQLGVAVATAMTVFSRKIGFPYKLSEIKGFSDLHISRALEAAKNPQLKSKLENMPVPLSPDQVEEYMRPVLEAAKTGDFNKIKVMKP
ncbi:MAG: iron-containing alcohol dehydrogenase [Cyanobacteria bacterium]|nr:iron-containing alcohol dehydrogenase [Cyanobacteriota bacterium]